MVESKWCATSISYVAAGLAHKKYAGSNVPLILRTKTESGISGAGSDQGQLVRDGSARPYLRKRLKRFKLSSSYLRTVKDIMTGKVVCLEERNDLADVMEIMQRGKFRHVPIVDKQKSLVGIISDRDVLRHLPFREDQCELQAEVFRTGLFYVDPKEPIIRQPISRIMKRDITYVPPDCRFHDAVKMLYGMKISCLSVINDGKKLLGIVTVTDVIRGLLAAYALFEINPLKHFTCRISVRQATFNQFQILNYESLPQTSYFLICS